MIKRRINWKILVISFLIVFTVAFVGSLFTSTNTDTAWYDSIKPEITPPNWVFPIVWNVLFVLIALSLYFSWANSKNKKDKEKIILAFGINFILNIFWSVLYFTLKNPFVALLEIFVLWSSIMFMIYVTYGISKKAAYLLVPYLLWVSFATILNYLTVF